MCIKTHMCLEPFEVLFFTKVYYRGFQELTWNYTGKIVNSRRGFSMSLYDGGGWLFRNEGFYEGIRQLFFVLTTDSKGNFKNF